MNVPFHQLLRHERELRGWSQADLASRVGVDLKTVQRWENGKSRPRSYARQKLSKMLGMSIEELGLMDNPLNMTLPLPTDAEAEIPASLEKGQMPTESSLSDESIFRSILQEDWGEAPRVSNALERTLELGHMLKWLKDNSCQVIAIVGVGGVGKTTFASLAAERTRDTFSYLFWRSLHNAPPLEQILKSCIRFLSRQQQGTLPDSEDDLITLLQHSLRHHRCLLILDNFESILQPQQRSGQYKKGYEGYGRLIQRLGETPHASCLMLTSRDKPREVVQLEGSLSPVRSFALQGVDASEGQAILQDKGLFGSDAEWAELIRFYSGNPLALKLIAEPIQEVFAGSLSTFLSDGGIAFGDLSDVLEQQVQRLASQEQDILYWLAIEREAVSLEELRDDLLQQIQKSELVDVVTSLRRRSLIKTRKPTSFTLQPVIMEYMVTRLVKHLCDEFLAETSNAWTKFALLKAQAKDYVRESQRRVLLELVAEQLLDRFGREGLKAHVQEQLAAQRRRDPLQRSYKVGNILNVLISLKYEIRGFDFSHFMIRQAYLQNVALPGVNFASAHFVAPVFTHGMRNEMMQANP